MLLMLYCLLFPKQGKSGCESFKLVINGKTYYHGPDLAVFELPTDSIEVLGKFGGSCNLSNLKVYLDAICLHDGNGHFKIPPKPGVYIFRGFSSTATIDEIPVEIKEKVTGLTEFEYVQFPFLIKETADELKIEFPEPPSEVLLVNSHGKIIVFAIPSAKLTINTADLPIDIYTLFARYSSGGYARRKFVLQKL